jgi:CRISPR/Cas system-associated exonuclease Cas4 (RecB family)
MPYLEQGEFYSEFGNFDVRITVPKKYVVAATGELQNEDERKWLLGRIIHESVKKKQNQIKKSYKSKPLPNKTKQQSTNNLNDTSTKTLQYLQNNVHDFAWFADERFVVQS